MGYRNYFYSLPVEEYEKIKNLNKKELKELYKGKDLDDDDDYFYIYDIPSLKQVYEFGKYCDFDISHTLCSFYGDSSMEDGDTEFEIANRETFRIIIEHYIEKVKLLYKNLIEKNDHQELFDHVKSMGMEWTHDFAVNLHRETPVITSSWKYEYSIFELIRIYKNFDFKNYVLIYAGH
jgi:hypothetical protein